MDIERLIEEQKKTQAMLEELRGTESFEKFIEKIPEAELDWRDRMPNFNPWDYDEVKLAYNLAAGNALRLTADNIGKFKAYVKFVDNFYEFHIKQWEDFREYCQKEFGKQTKKWAGYISNPDCLDFFEKYEKDNGIKDSIYQQAKKLKGKKTKEEEGEV